MSPPGRQIEHHTQRGTVVVLRGVLGQRRQREHTQDYDQREQTKAATDHQFSFLQQNDHKAVSFLRLAVNSKTLPAERQLPYFTVILP
jgi:hypothetical protein